jgi:aminomethyltransferase
MNKTQVNQAHYILKGKMVEFAGWDMPVQYSGINAEHLAVRTSGGIFDVSHMGEIFFSGKQALEAVQYISSNNAAKLIPGKIQYSALLLDNGCFVDDLLIYMLAEDRYMLVVNAANIEKDFKYMRQKAGHFDVQIDNESDHYAQIAIQGPLSEKLLSQFTSVDLSQIGYYRFTTGKVMEIDCIISRTGYTGEDGFEVYFKSGEDAAVKMFLEFSEEGQKYDIVPCGLGARDTLRLEAGMALYGSDIDDSHTVLEAGLGWILKLKKGDFIGREVLQRQKEEGIQRKLVGFELTGRGIGRHGYPVYVNGQAVGPVTSGTFAPFLKKPIGMTYLPIENTTVGAEFHIGIRDKTVSARVVETPFYKRDT